MLLWLVFLLVLNFASPDEGNPIIILKDGKVKGLKRRSRSGREYNAFYGLPFAKPPVGSLRFKDPQPNDPWNDVLDATTDRPECLQPPLDILDVRSKWEPTLIGQEDCLYLNVFTPSISSSPSTLPVMVFIHGGGFFFGGAREYGEEYFMDEDVVYVVLQYRLGILGFLTNGGKEITGNFGLKDQTLGLRWIQENIVSFGGDPSLVTLSGESAGGASTHLQMLSPWSEGLFSQAILQSGCALAPWGVRDDYQEAFNLVSGHFNCSGLKGDKLLQCLQDAPDTEIAFLMYSFFTLGYIPMKMAPWVDGDFIPDDPAILIREGKHKKINIMSGLTRNEGSFIGFIFLTSPEEWGSYLRDFCSHGPTSLSFMPSEEYACDFSKMAFEFYVGGLNITEDNVDRVSDILGDRMFSIPQDVVSQLHLQNKAGNVYMYEFNYVGGESIRKFHNPGELGKDWACHADDLMYLYSGNEHFPVYLSYPQDIQVSEVMVKLFTNFARTGNPTPDESLGFVWEPATVDSFHHLSINSSPKMEKYYKEKERKFWTSLPTKQNFLLFPQEAKTKKEEL